MSDIKLKDLVGLHALDAVDYSTEQVKDYDGFQDANCITFRLNGVVYRVIEDPSDGYRSSMEKIEIIPKAKMKNVFNKTKVFCIHATKGTYGDTSDLLQIYDAKSAKLILEVGTENVSDYYPCFVAKFSPENMKINEGK